MSEPEPKPPWWLAARTARGALVMGIYFSFMAVAFVAAYLSRTSLWYLPLGVLQGLLAAMEWASFAYLRKRPG